jgi:hypothetical protein
MWPRECSRLVTSANCTTSTFHHVWFFCVSLSKGKKEEEEEEEEKG